MKYVGGLLAFVACLSCGGSGNGPSSPNAAQEDFPSVDTGETNALCATRGPTTYMIASLSDHVTDPSASNLEARMRVGEELAMQVAGFGCGSWATGDWESTDPAAAAIADVNPVLGWAFLKGVAPGQTRVLATFKAGNGKTYKTTLAYCPPAPGCLTRDQGSWMGGCPCANPRKIDVVNVLPR